MSKEKKTRIKITDLPADLTVSPEEMRKIMGGFYEIGYNYFSIRFLQERGRRTYQGSQEPVGAIPITVP